MEKLEGLVLAHWRGRNPGAALQCQGWEKDHAKTEQETRQKARGRDSLHALSKLTTVVDGRRRIIDDPPLLVRIPEGDEIKAQITAIRESY